MSAWGTANRKHLVLIPEKVHAVFDVYRQLDPYAEEAGGILLGKRRGNHIELLVATEPSLHDKRARTLFTRQPQIHQEIADRLWRESGGEIAYLGEWHTHPEVAPHPSPIDLNNTKNILQKHTSHTTLLFIIVGTSGLYVELSSGNSIDVLHQLES